MEEQKKKVKCQHLVTSFQNYMKVKRKKSILKESWPGKTTWKVMIVTTLGL